MFQTYDDEPEGRATAERVKLVRGHFKRLRIAALLVPRADEYLGEYVPPSGARLKWATGFSGSAGLAVILPGVACLFVDGRYTSQARQEVDGGVYEVRQVPEAKLSDYLVEKLKKRARVGYDPRLHTIGEIERLQESLKPKGIELVPLAENPIDIAWTDRPEPPLAPIHPHELEHAGVDSAAKIAGIRAELAKSGDAAVVLTQGDAIAWTFNIRGGDVKHTPFALAYAIVPAKGKPSLFIDRCKVSANVRGHIAAVARLEAPERLSAALEALGKRKASVRLDPAGTSAWFFATLQEAGAKIHRAPDPTLLPKAKKNAAELSGARAAHIRDAIAVTKFLAWLDHEAAKGGLDEVTLAKRLEDFRRATGALKEISFDTIAGAGPNGALAHYRPTVASSRPLQRGEIVVIDSGGQYLDGTTDITRTVAIGEPPREAAERATLVLKGHIAIATARFPKGTRGQDLDPFARRALWLAGLDFDHGTGHGVGSYLSVHEGPQRISRLGSEPLEPGMIISNEPGYYKAGHYGIRLENLLVVTPPERVPGGDREMMAFETISFAPFDRRLIVPEMLDEAERKWLDDYHARVRKVVAKGLEPREKAWLEEATRPLGTGIAKR
ncbi:MAG: aminopeptidase P family protein [Hyphomicrobiaceae bacterium]|nr:MAG: aminopeptidase P family protein [Hyphomicrobiaceae bacterium]